MDSFLAEPRFTGSELFVQKVLADNNLGLYDRKEAQNLISGSFIFTCSFTTEARVCIQEFNEIPIFTPMEV